MMESVAMATTDEDLARLLRFAEEPSHVDPRVLHVPAARQRPGDSHEMSDEALARLLQAIEEEEEMPRTWQRLPPIPSQRREPPPAPPGADCLPFVAEFLSSGAFFGCATALQVTVFLGFGNLTSCLCAALGCFIGHAQQTATQGPSRRRGTHPRPPQEVWEMQPTELAEQPLPRRGLDASVIEGFTVGHLYTCPQRDSSSGHDADDDEEAGKCLVCMEEYQVGDAVRTLPCLHRYHRSCIDEWFGRSSECPICKRDITELALPPEVATGSPGSSPGGFGFRLSQAIRGRRRQ